MRLPLQVQTNNMLVTESYFQDVYKRQTMIFVLSIFVFSPFFFCLPDDFRAFVQYGSHGMVSVSYTHLDVYKRQVLSGDKGRER